MKKQTKPEKLIGDCANFRDMGPLEWEELKQNNPILYAHYLPRLNKGSKSQEIKQGEFGLEYF